MNFDLTSNKEIYEEIHQDMWLFPFLWLCLRLPCTSHDSYVISKKQKKNKKKQQQQQIKRKSKKEVKKKRNFKWRCDVWFSVFLLKKDLSILSIQKIVFARLRYPWVLCSYQSFNKSMVRYRNTLLILVFMGILIVKKKSHSFNDKSFVLKQTFVPFDLRKAIQT